MKPENFSFTWNYFCLQLSSWKGTKFCTSTPDKNKVRNKNQSVFWDGDNRENENTIYLLCRIEEKCFSQWSHNELGSATTTVPYRKNIQQNLAFFCASFSQGCGEQCTDSRLFLRQLQLGEKKQNLPVLLCWIEVEFLKSSSHKEVTMNSRSAAPTVPYDTNI